MEYLRAQSINIPLYHTRVYNSYVSSYPMLQVSCTIQVCTTIVQVCICVCVCMYVCMYIHVCILWNANSAKIKYCVKPSNITFFKFGNPLL